LQALSAVFGSTSSGLSNELLVLKKINNNNNAGITKEGLPPRYQKSYNNEHPILNEDGE